MSQKPSKRSRSPALTCWTGWPRGAGGGKGRRWRWWRENRPNRGRGRATGGGRRGTVRLWRRVRGGRRPLRPFLLSQRRRRVVAATTAPASERPHRSQTCGYDTPIHAERAERRRNVPSPTPPTPPPPHPTLPNADSAYLAIVDRAAEVPPERLVARKIVLLPHLQGPGPAALRRFGWRGFGPHGWQCTRRPLRRSRRGQRARAIRRRESEGRGGDGGE